MNLIEISDKIIRKCNSEDIVFVVKVFHYKLTVMILTADNN